MKKSLAILLLLGVVGCGVSSQPVYTYPLNGPSMVSGAGYVRSIDYYHMTFVHETDNGFQKLFDVCGSSVVVWQGEHANIHFHWHQFSDITRGCDVIESVEHLKGDVK